MTETNKIINIVIECPHCNQGILIEQLNCRIFRHAVYKNNMQSIPPHSTKEECDRLFESGQVYGCTKPFRVEGEGDTIFAISCDYI
jgi:hypothetical protein